MKKLMMMTLMSASLLAGTPIEKEVPINNLFIPSGFDSNDNVEVIVSGFLPNLCHKSPRAQVEKRKDGAHIKVTSLYYDESNPFCPEMIVPFKITVSLGVMDTGNYQIKVNEDTPYAQDKGMKILESTSNSIDNYHYAYVENVLKKQGSREVHLKGYNPSDCFVLDKIETISNKSDTLSVLPKMKQIRDFCPRKMVPFTYKYEVPEVLEAKEILLHVRTMDGKSVNTLFYQY